MPTNIDPDSIDPEMQRLMEESDAAKAVFDAFLPSSLTGGEMGDALLNLAQAMFEQSEDADGNELDIGTVFVNMAADLEPTSNDTP